ncbi:[LSU ribosomal protein L3P]-glutamine N5-methyltransferase [Alteromonadaceae bacterium Bs31]|nr:[LSU ribosomal protein L3P]-glutamine N5-methyltransferase [Alteromonadaceae bacterium Bs31]
MRDWIRWGSSEFSRRALYFGHGTDNPWDEAALLVMWALQQPWPSLERIYDTRLSTDERHTIFALFRERITTRKPAAYLTGEAWFCGMSFEVTEDVLVPRSPIAELIQAGFEPWLSVYPARILDLCTGSGCIGLACAAAFAEAEVDISDISPLATTLAEKNAQHHGLQARVNVIEADLFSSELFAGKVYDLIVSNPPYVDAKDLASMPEEYHREPVLGLQAGDDGLDIVRKILSQASDYLSEDGLLVVEVGNSWAALEEAYPHVEFFWPEFENGGHGVFILTAQAVRDIVSAEKRF